MLSYFLRQYLQYRKEQQAYLPLHSDPTSPHHNQQDQQRQQQQGDGSVHMALLAAVTRFGTSRSLLPVYRNLLVVVLVLMTLRSVFVSLELWVIGFAEGHGPHIDDIPGRDIIISLVYI